MATGRKRESFRPPPECPGEILVTGSVGHLGGALLRTLPARGHEALGIDRLPSPFTQRIGSITDRGFVRECMAGIDAVLHKPHVATHLRQAVIDVNLGGTLKLIEFLRRRGDIDDVIEAHPCAIERAPALGFGRYIISAATPLVEADLAWLRVDAAGVSRELVPGF